MVREQVTFRLLFIIEETTFELLTQKGKNNIRPGGKLGEKKAYKAEVRGNREGSY